MIFAPRYAVVLFCWLKFAQISIICAIFRHNKNEKKCKKNAPAVSHVPQLRTICRSPLRPSAAPGVHHHRRSRKIAPLLRSFGAGGTFIYSAAVRGSARRLCPHVCRSRSPVHRLFARRSLAVHTPFIVPGFSRFARGSLCIFAGSLPLRSSGHGHKKSGKNTAFSWCLSSPDSNRLLQSAYI